MIKLEKTFKFKFLNKRLNFKIWK